MTEYELKNIDSEDIEDVLAKVESSFNIKFVDNELVHIATFGQLCDHIIDKIQLDNSDDCTSQQAFYKLRDAISKTISIDKKAITTDFPLIRLLPRHSRRSVKNKLEEHLGFKLHILRPPHWVTGTLAILLLASIVVLFFNWQYGLAGFVFSIIGIWLANKMGNELSIQTVGQLAEQMTRENYLKSRRDPKTFNKREVEKILLDLFSDSLELNKNKLSAVRDVLQGISNTE